MFVSSSVSIEWRTCLLRSRLARSSTLRSPISTIISIAEKTQISFPLHASPCDPVPVQQIDGIINVPVPQIPEPIVEAVKHIPQEWVQQRVVLQIAAACGRYWIGAPKAHLGVCRRQCPSCGHHQALTIQTEQKALEVPPKLYSGQMVEDARLRPIRLRTIRLRPAGRNRIGRNRNWPKSKLIGRNRTDGICSVSSFSLSFLFSFAFSLYFSFLFLLIS